MVYKYATQTEGIAKACSTDLPISTKVSREICRAIKGKNVERAKKILQDAKDMKKAIPYTKYNSGVGHKTKMGPGRYPIKACETIIKIINSAEANARFKGVNTENLIIKNILAQKAAETFKYGRQSRRRAKRTHVEVVLAEGIKKATTKKEAVPEDKKNVTKAPAKEVAEKPKTTPVKKEETKPAVQEKKEVVKEPEKEVVKEEKEITNVSEKKPEEKQ